MSYCDEHDVPLTEHGCWVCGHAGPITEPAWNSFARWVVDQPPFGLTFPSLAV